VLNTGIVLPEYHAQFAFGSPMRIRVTSSPPLPEIKAWFSLKSMPENTSVSSLKERLCTTIQALRDARVRGEDVILLLDDFELLGEIAVDILRDGDLVWWSLIIMFSCVAY